MEYLKVLIVDDEPPAVENLCTMIDWEGHGFQEMCIRDSALQGWRAVRILPDTNGISLGFG